VNVEDDVVIGDPPWKTMTFYRNPGVRPVSGVTGPGRL